MGAADEHAVKVPGGPGGEGGPRNNKKRKAFGMVSLTDKEKEFILEYLRTGNATRSVIHAYNVATYDSAQALASTKLKKLRPTFQNYLESHDFGLEDLFRAMKDGLGAEKYEKAGLGRFEKVPDHTVREKFLRHASKWLNVPTPPEAVFEQENAGIVVNVYEPSLKRGAMGRLGRVPFKPEPEYPSEEE